MKHYIKWFYVLFFMFTMYVTSFAIAAIYISFEEMRGGDVVLQRTFLLVAGNRI